MSITAVGSLAVGNPIPVSPTALGDVMVAFFAVDCTISVSHILSVSGGGVTTWDELTPSSTTGENYTRMWWGVITTTGSSTITPTYDDTAYLSYVAYAAQQFTSSVPGTWTADSVYGVADDFTTLGPSTGNYPSVIPTGSHELYVGAGIFLLGTDAGATTGFTYTAFGSGSYAEAVWNENVSNPTAQAPNWSAPSGVTVLGVSSGLLIFAVPGENNIVMLL